MESVEYQLRGSIAVMTLHNGDENQITENLLDALEQALRRFASDDAARAAMITGHGAVFSRGADRRQLGLMYNSDAARPIVSLIRSADKPVVAWINGVAAGAGAEIAIACHARVATSNAAIAFSDIVDGFPPGAGATQHLPRLVGVLPALPLLLDGTTLGAVQAYEAGLIDAVYPVQDIDDVAERLALAFDTGRFGVLPRDTPLDADAVEAALVLHHVEGRALRDGETFAAISAALRAGARSYEAGMQVELAQYRAAEESPARKANRDLAVMRQHAAQRIYDADTGPDHAVARRWLIADALPPGCSVLDDSGEVVCNADTARGLLAARAPADAQRYAILVMLPEDMQAARERLFAVLAWTKPSDLVLGICAHVETVIALDAALHRPRLAFAFCFGGHPKTALQPVLAPWREPGVVAALCRAAARFDFYLFHTGKGQSIGAALDADWRNVLAALPVPGRADGLAASPDFRLFAGVLEVSGDAVDDDFSPSGRSDKGRESEVWVDRCCALVNIGSHYLDKQILLHPEDFDLLCLQAYGFPRKERGPMLWALARTLEWVVDRLKTLETRSDGKIEIAALLKRVTAPKSD